jgi:predicted ATPase/Tfp pilus assembly protein PilF
VPDLPRGTVTFLFTDIEGSTRLLHDLGPERYANALAEHRVVLRDAFARHGGVEVDTQGDAFFVAFPTAPSALAAAREAQEELALPVRMGLHTGTPLLTAEGYVGPDVHRAARIAAAGNGRQVLVSAATAALIDSGGLRDLGEHRLKDLSARERIYQWGEWTYPRLKTLHQTNLPVQPNTLVGRAHELAEISELLRAGTLVTLTGPGGSGKTRLALQAAAELADEFPDGVWFVSLAAVTDAALVESTVAQVLGAPDDLNAFVREKKLLLLLDNLEQLLPEAAPVVASLEARVLATSRERLNVSREQEYPVPTLPPTEAVTLFTQRARQLKPNFERDEHVTEIASRLDGLPLALELAAARVKVLTPEQILARLEGSLDLLTSGSLDVPERQRTLRATIEWSDELLDEVERRLFGALAVFAGSFDLEAAETVAGADIDTLGSLVDKSLLRQTVDGRFFMLETIREYALERLDDAGEAQALRASHAAFFVAFAEGAEQGLRTNMHAAWLARLDAERDNLRAAIETLLRAGGGDDLLRLTSSMLRFWETRSASEGRQWLESALLADAASSPEPRGRAAFGLARLMHFQGDYDEATERFHAAIDLAREVEDLETLILSLGKLSWVYEERGAEAEALAIAEECLELADRVEDPWLRAEAFNDVGSELANSSEDERGEALLEESLALRRALGDEDGVGESLNNLGWAAIVRGAYPKARAYLEESLEIARRLEHDLRMAITLSNLGLVAVFEGRYADAVELLTESVRVCAERADRRTGSESVHALAGAFAGVGNDAAAVTFAATAYQLLESMGTEPWPMLEERVAPLLAQANASFDAASAEALKNEGRALTLMQAADLAADAAGTQPRL